MLRDTAPCDRHFSSLAGLAMRALRKHIRTPLGVAASLPANPEDFKAHFKKLRSAA